jgi:phage-related protein
MKNLRVNFKVIPLPVVKHEAKKMLNPAQLKAAIDHTKKLKYYPQDVGLSIGSCGEGFELRIKDSIIDKQGWLRAGFWVHEKTRIIYIVDVFWKKTNRISQADIIRINHRIRRVKLALSASL